MRRKEERDINWSSLPHFSFLPFLYYFTNQKRRKGGKGRVKEVGREGGKRERERRKKGLGRKRKGETINVFVLLLSSFLPSFLPFKAQKRREERREGRWEGRR